MASELASIGPKVRDCTDDIHLERRVMGQASESSVKYSKLGIEMTLPTPARSTPN